MPPRGSRLNRHNVISDKTVGRLSLYRRLLTRLLEKGEEQIFSHRIATLSGASAAQVRRDLMVVGYQGTPSRGYDVKELCRCIEEFLHHPGGQRVALVGLGNLGRAIVSFFGRFRPSLQIVASFDTDPSKTGRVIHGCHCYALEEIEEVVRELRVTIGILTVPPTAAQAAATALVEAGVGGILNFAPISLQVPEHVYVEDIDLTMSLEKTAYFARHPE